MNHTHRLLITGATGFIGGALAARLIYTERWKDCLFLARGTRDADGFARLVHSLRQQDIPENIIHTRLHRKQIIEGDLNNVAVWKNDHRLAAVEAVVSSAAVASFGNHPSIWPTNVKGVFDMAQALMARGNLRRFLQIGTAMACGNQAPTLVPEGYDAGEETEHFLQYTASKYEIEQRLRTELPELPLIVARPSIVVGHSRLGCLPSGSIFWVFRMARALQCFPCELSQVIDVVPVDYCAEALHWLLDKPVLQYRNYHISAGTQRACSFGDIDRAIAKGTNQAPMKNYQVKSYEEISRMQGQFSQLLGACIRRMVLRAIRSYGNFSALGMTFDNARLLEEGMRLPPFFTEYAANCEKTSKGVSIAEQMRFDYK